MKKLTFLIAIFSITFLACSSNSDVDPDEETTSGKADITVTAGGEELKIQGPCGWARAGGVNYIGANHSSSSLRVFEVSFNIDKLPTKTTTYSLTGDILDEDPERVHMTVTDMNGGITEWSSFVGSGNLTLKVDGKKVTADLSGIKLKAGSTNKGAFANEGSLKGTLELYAE